MRTMTEAEALVAEARELSAGDRDLESVAKKLVKDLSMTTLRKLAALYIVRTVRERNRAEARAREQKATAAATSMAENTSTGHSPMVQRILDERPPRASRPQYTDEQRERFAQEDAERSARFHSEMQALIGDFTEAMRVQWTEELMDSMFALTDGTMVTWGDATLDQHRERIGIFEANALANVQGAARHEKAVQALERSGKRTLREMVELSPLS